MSRLIRSIYIVLVLIGMQSQSLQAGIPRSKDLVEKDEWQRRDLSFPNSRIVLNFYDFNSRKTASEYSNRASLPLNAAYLSTDKNEKGHHPRTRFSRAVTDLLTIRNSSLGFDAMVKDSTIGFASKYTTEWMPHCLPFSAQYENNRSLDGVDFFYNEKTIVRNLKFSGETDGYCLSGSYAGIISFDNNILLVDNDNVVYAINFGELSPKFRLNKSSWSADIKIRNKNVSLVVAFADRNETKQVLIDRVRKPFIDNNIAEKYCETEKYWDAFLTKVPHPRNFSLNSVNTFGVETDQIESAYYKAWVFTAQNVLPEDAEKYPYPQVCTGKASLWDEGEVRAPFSAAWESFIGIQMYAYVAPQLGWKAFKGLMTLIDEEGMLGGESLPSRKAQTAMILYELTGDRKSLLEVYPALKRYMNWRLKITHWVYMDIKPSEKVKDAEFAFSALIDMEHMASIAGILGLNADKKEWKRLHKILSGQSLKWFWETPQSMPVQYYNTDDHSRNSGNTIWVTTALYADGLLKGDYLTSMMKRFDADYNPDSPFAGFSIPKYPDISYSVYGLLKHGYTQKAQSLIEANLRDIVRAKASFAEQYIGENFEPDGVRPSLFGSSVIIDFVWLLNGYKYDRGTPTPVPFNKGNGGLDNIRLKINK